MTENKINTEEEVSSELKKLEKDALSSGYHLNPDTAFTKELVNSLLVNKKRYGYMACPCRLASGDKSKDLDIICPCDYRDPDLDWFDCCFCGLYVSSSVARGEKSISSIPDRRRTMKKDEVIKKGSKGTTGLSYPVWRCKVCGYLCARENPPEVCPVCKAERERFEKFMEPPGL